MVSNYAKNTPNPEDLPPEVLSSTLDILNKCINLEDRNAPLMCKVLALGDNLYRSKIKPKVNSLNLIQSMSNDIDKFCSDHNYLNACLNSLDNITRDSP